MLLGLIKKFLGIETDYLSVNKISINKNRQIPKTNVKYSTPTFDLNGSNVVHAELKNKKEIEDLYAEIRVLQAQNREKINKNKISCNISK